MSEERNQFSILLRNILLSALMFILALGCLAGIASIFFGKILPFIQADKLGEGQIVRIETLDQHSSRINSHFILLEIEYLNGKNIPLTFTHLEQKNLRAPYRQGQKIALRYSAEGHSLIDDSAYFLTTPILITIGCLLVGSFIWLCFFAFIYLILSDLSPSRNCFRLLDKNQDREINNRCIPQKRARRGTFKTCILVCLLGGLSAACLYSAASIFNESAIEDAFNKKSLYAEGKIIGTQYISNKNAPLLARTEIEYKNEKSEPHHFTEVERVGSQYSPYTSDQNVKVRYTPNESPRIDHPFKDFYWPLLLCSLCLLGFGIYIFCACCACWGLLRLLGKKACIK